MAKNRYTQILESIFFAHYRKGMKSFSFERSEMETTAAKLGVVLPKNIGDLIYAFRFRNELPVSILAEAPRGKAWVIKLAGKATYQFVLDCQWTIKPNTGLIEIKIPEATPGIIARYALNDEQALLALVRYNRLIDIFTGVASYSLQNHLRTTVDGIGQVEVDELYVGIDRRGAHYVFPLQAKGGKDKLGHVQIEQDIALCAEKFPNLICRSLGAQFLPDGAIALLEFAETNDGVRLTAERHYRLVPEDLLTSADLESYKALNEVA